MASWRETFSRKKFRDPKTMMVTQLNRCLGIFDLTLLGVGITIGAGLYVLTPEIARKFTGPSVVVSYFIAASASVLAGLCYAEFGCRVPKAGSVYAYSYSIMGELCAFIIGWDLILEYSIGLSSVAKATSSYLDALFDDRIKNLTISAIGEIHVKGFAQYPDLLSVVLIFGIALISLIGMKETSRFNTLVTVLTMLPIIVIVFAGLYYADIKNWTDDFAPYGASGILTGAGTLFYAFVGFDVIATTAEEVRNPGRTIPISIVLTLVIAFMAYFGASAALTLAWPYATLPERAAFSTVFEWKGAPWAKYMISIGAICGLITSMLGCLVALSRMVYAIANDGLLFKFLGKVNQRTEVPQNATIMTSVFCSLLAFIFDIYQLAEMLSIGTLLAYTLVALCVLVLRYQPDVVGLTKLSSARDDGVASEADKDDTPGEESPLITTNNASQPTATTNSKARFAIGVNTFACIALVVILRWGSSALEKAQWWAIILIILIGFTLVGSAVLLTQLPQNNTPLAFKVPGVPVIPLLSTFVNLLLISQLSYLTWLRFAVWLVIGLMIYLTYGVRHSVEGKRNSQDWPDLRNTEPEICLQKSQDYSEPRKE